MAKDGEFFEVPRPASKIKTKIVVDYFKSWASIMARVVANEVNPRLRYLDLFSGPGRYDDGTPSTPLLILEHAIATSALCNMLLALFNDSNPKHIEELKKNIKGLPGLEKLRNQPRVRAGEVDKAFVDRLKNVGKVPTFSFVDPFGYKGLSLELVETLVQGWGNDLVLFFSFNSINRALTNPLVNAHVDVLFGEKRANELRIVARQVHTEKREELLIEKFIEAVNDLGFDFVIPYVFEQDDKDRTSHYLTQDDEHCEWRQPIGERA